MRSEMLSQGLHLAYRQYNMDNGMRIDFKDMARVVGETWRTLTPKERAPYEGLARQETVCYEKEKRVHEEKQRHYTSLYHKAAAAGMPLDPPACLTASQLTIHMM